MRAETEKKIVLSILNAWKDDGTDKEVPWHVTDLGWQTYSNHQDTDIRNAAIHHPYFGCPTEHLQERRKEYKKFTKEAVA